MPGHGALNRPGIGCYMPSTKWSNSPAWTPRAKASHLVRVVVTTVPGAEVSRRNTKSPSPKAISIRGQGRWHRRARPAAR